MTVKTIFLYLPLSSKFCVCVSACACGQLLFARLFHGPKLRWRDMVQHDLRNIDFDSTSWYVIVHDSATWYV